MSDHDRGAYTPHNDAPLSFDARQSRGRRGFPTTLVISLVILVVLVGAIVMFYRSGVRGAGEAPTPVGAPVGQIKAPAPAGQAQPEGDAAANLQIYKSEAPAASSGAPAGGPVFAAGPEQPAPRPAPTTPVTAEPVAPVTAKPVQATAPAAPPPQAAAAAQVAASGATTKATAAPTPAPAKPAPAAKAKPAGDEVDALLKANPPKAAAPAPSSAKPVQVAEAKPAPAPAPAKPVAQGAAVVQIGAYSSSALAGKGWSDIAAAYPADMAGKGKLVESVERDGKTLFRGAVSGFASHADAVAFCGKLKADGKACIVR